MSPSSTITAIGSSHGREFITHEVFIACTPMATAAKDSDLVNKIGFFHGCYLCLAKILGSGLLLGA
jgi:hypothetical protein